MTDNRIRYIFLDIDGPMIPDTAFLFERNPSFGQVLWEPAVMVLRKIVLDLQAQDKTVYIIFNTTHNNSFEFNKKFPDTPGLRNVFTKAGFENNIYNPCPRTDYPNVWPTDEELANTPKRDDGNNSHRLIAIKRWLKKNNAAEDDLWIAFDDEDIPHKRACLVSPDAGLTIKHYFHAAKYLMFKRSAGLMLF